jgi:hypothetical protein
VYLFIWKEENEIDGCGCRRSRRIASCRHRRVIRGRSCPVRPLPLDALKRGTTWLARRRVRGLTYQGLRHVVPRLDERVRWLRGWYACDKVAIPMRINATFGLDLLRDSCWRLYFIRSIFSCLLSNLYYLFKKSLELSPLDIGSSSGIARFSH